MKSWIFTFPLSYSPLLFYIMHCSDCSSFGYWELSGAFRPCVCVCAHVRVRFWHFLTLWNYKTPSLSWIVPAQPWDRLLLQEAQLPPSEGALETKFQPLVGVVTARRSWLGDNWVCAVREGIFPTVLPGSGAGSYSKLITDRLKRNTGTWAFITLYCYMHSSIADKNKQPLPSTRFQYFGTIWLAGVGGDAGRLGDSGCFQERWVGS